MADLSAASEEDVKNFFRLYYAPNNAFLSIVGDFDPAQAKAWVAKYFGDIPRGRAITRPAVDPVTLTDEKRLVYEDRVQVPRLYVQWPTVGEKSDDQFALDVLGAILTGPRTARLTKALVSTTSRRRRTCPRGQGSNEDVGEFLMVITPRPGHSLTDLEAAADAIIEKMKAEGPTAEEIQKAIAGEELDVRPRPGVEPRKAMTLSDGAGFHGDPGYFKTEYQKTLAVTAADVKRVANKYLTNGRVVLSIVPTGKLDQAAKPDESRKVTANLTSRGRSDDEARRQSSGSAVLAIARWRCWLSLPVVGAAGARSHAVSRRREDPGASRARVDPRQPGERRRAGRVRKARSAARLLFDHVPRRRRSVRESRPARRRCADGGHDERGHEDPRRRGAVECAAAARRRRSRPTSAASPARSAFVSTAGKFPQTLDILADMLLQFHVPGGRARAAPAAAAGRADAGAGPARRDRRRACSRACCTAQAHPFGQPVTEESLKAITRDDVAAFHQAYFQPGRALITVVGDVQAATVARDGREGAGRLAAGGDKPSFTYPQTPAPAADDDLPRRQAGRGAVDVCDRAFPGRRGTRRTTTRCRS